MPISRQDLAELIREHLQDISLESLIAFITNDFRETIEYLNLADGRRGCQRTSLLFNPHRLATRTLSSKASIIDALKDPAYCDGLARAVLFKLDVIPTSSILYAVLELGVNGIQFVNEFPPAVARDICAEAELTPESAVLDPCSGWGGRLLGSSTVAGRYVGFEPSTRTAAGLVSLAGWIGRFRPDFRADIRCEPFELSADDGERFDLALTSPPYYDTEIYAEDEATQSTANVSSFDAWLESFFEPLIVKTMRRLKPGAAFILNIGDRNYPLSESLKAICAKHQLSWRRIDNYLSGGGGLGKENSDGEVFFEIKAID